MNLALLNQNIQQFINDNLNQNITQLSLQKNSFPEIKYAEIINQIVAKKKAILKLPTWFNTENIYYPESISIEQSSSEITAKYKANLVSGEKIIDLSGGFGVDCYYFAKQFKTVYHCEINTDLSNIVKHNFEVLNQKNINCIAQNSFDFLKENNDFFDVIYVDPSRRSSTKGKVFLLKDCLPNLPENLDFYFGKANTILIKTAPILDLTAGLNELKHVKQIHVVAINNEVKEILWLLEKNFEEKTTLFSVNIEKNKTHKNSFYFQEKSNYSMHLPQKYLYEPNAAILKSGEVNSLSKQLNINKLHQHSHLFTSDEMVDFPGRIFEIEQVLPYNKKDIDKQLKNTKLNITTRNFQLTVAEIRKKHKIFEGGNLYSFFTTNQNNEKIVLICKKV